MPAMTPPASATVINTFGADAATIERLLGPLVAHDRNPTVTTAVAAAGTVQVHIHSRYSDTQRTQSQLEDTAHQVQERLGPWAYGRDTQTIQGSLVQLLIKHHRTLATAESCTGGLIGKMITDVPGSSEAYVGGWIVYTNQMKTRHMGVPNHLIEQHGAVSEPVVGAMASGVIEHSDATMSVAVTGIAGPDGGSPNKPVGTVWIGLGFKSSDGDTPTRTQAFCCHLPGNRAAVRDHAAMVAVQLLRFALLNAPPKTTGLIQHISNS